MTLNRALLSSEAMTYETPGPLFESLDALFAFTLDAAASAKNAKTPRYFDERANGLAQSWEGETVWLNPPYGRALPSWIHRARRAALEERAIVVLLVPYRPDTEWWGLLLNRDGEAGRLRCSRYMPEDELFWWRWQSLVVGVHGYRGRLTFGDPADGKPIDGTGAPFPTALIVLAHPSRRPPAPRRFSEEHDPNCPLLTRGWPR